MNRSPPLVPIAHTDPHKTRLFGINVDHVDLDGAVARIAEWATQKNPYTVITPNLDHVAKLRTNPAFQTAYDHADMIVADGMPFVWMSKLAGDPLPGRVAGSDLIIPVCQAAAVRGLSLYFVGSTVDRLKDAARILQEKVPGLKVSGFHAPPFGFETDKKAQQAAVEAVNLAGADIVLVALGAPKQEIWSQTFRTQLKCGVIMNIGGGLDFLSGDIARAPKWMQNAGLEWLWRAGTEPGRLGPRYLKLLAQAPGLVVHHYRTRKG